MLVEFFLNIIKTPAIILGLVAMIGLLLQRKKFGQVFSGSVKTAIGMLIVSGGATIIVTEILPFVDLFAKVFKLEGFATSSEAVVGAMQASVPEIAFSSSLIMAFGFVVNIIIARVSPLKYIFLTGHMMWILSVAIASGLYAADYGFMTSVIIGSLTQGLLMVVLPALSQPLVVQATKQNIFAIAHLTTVGTVAAGYIGGLLGDKTKSAEQVKLPESLEFFKDTAMSVSIVMGLFYFVVTISAGPEQVAVYANDTNYLIWALLRALGFTAGILILLQGVRMFLGELVPAFKGISDKLVPGAVPALDVPALFGFAPNSLMIGFVTGVVGMIIGMVASSMLFGVVPLVSIIGAFFTGGVAGIYGNATGGARGAVIAGLVYGFLLIFGSGFIFTIFDYATYGATGVGHDCVDVMLVLWLFQHPYLALGVIIAAFLILSYCQVIASRKKAAEQAAQELAKAQQDTKA